MHTVHTGAHFGYECAQGNPPMNEAAGIPCVLRHMQHSTDSEIYTYHVVYMVVKCIEFRVWSSNPGSRGKSHHRCRNRVSAIVVVSQWFSASLVERQSQRKWPGPSGPAGLGTGGPCCCERRGAGHGHGVCRPMERGSIASAGRRRR